jgi:multidrug transporter EmrE-like cation transporter
MTAKWLGILTLIVAMAVESIAQVALKVGASQGPRILSAPYDQWADRFRMTSSPTSWIAIGVIFYAIQIYLWTYVLHLLDLSIAFPMASLCFVGVALLSRIFLAERVGLTRWLGVLCILLGTVFLAL